MYALYEAGYAMRKTDILIIEDDHLVGEISRHILAAAGYSVQWVQESREALEAVKKAQPRLVITDIMMPGITGLDICKLITSDPDLARVKVLVMSAKSFEMEKLRAKMFGAHCFLPKPFTEKLLLSTVAELLRVPAGDPPRDNSLG